MTLSAALVGLPLAGGCRSGAQSDLVAREMRLQEDQIYALEDYLAQYQRLLQQCRAENMALQQQAIDKPGAAAPEGPQFPARDQRGGEVIVPDVPPVVVPDLRVPPVQNPPTGVERSATRATDRTDGSATDASLSQVPLRDDSPLPSSRRRSPISAEPERVWLHGEVVPNNSGGPRLIVNVEPLSASGEPTSYSGPLSLMVLATSEAGPPRGVARWEFSPAQAQSAVADAGSHAMQFRLEIPDDAPLAGTFELWVRLIAGEEGKLLAHARLDLQQPGGFASAPFDAADAQRPEGEIIASRFDHHEPDGLGPAAVAMTGGEGQWTIARHSIANISASAAATGGKWRTATGPPPVAMAVSSQRISERIPSADVKILPAPSTVQQVAHLETPEAADASNLPASREIVPPVWSPTR